MFWAARMVRSRGVEAVRYESCWEVVERGSMKVSCRWRWERGMGLGWAKGSMYIEVSGGRRVVGELGSGGVVEGE